MSFFHSINLGDEIMLPNNWYYDEGGNMVQVRDNMVVSILFLMPTVPVVGDIHEEEFMEPVKIHLTKTEFKQLNTRVMGKKLKKTIGVLDEEVDCVICQDEIRSRQHCTILKCNHTFHKKCISRWLVNDCQLPTCPCCRMDVREMI